MPVDLTKRWALAFRDRGHDHIDWAVIEELPKKNCSELGVPCTPIVEGISRELADHLIELHNQSLAICPACGTDSCQGHPVPVQEEDHVE